MKVTMKTILLVEIIANGNSGSFYKEISKEFELPFAPYKGLVIQFPARSVTTDEMLKVSEKYKLNNPPIAAVFELKAILFNLRTNTFNVKSQISLRTREECEEAVKWMVDIYDFESEDDE